MSKTKITGIKQAKQNLTKLRNKLAETAENEALEKLGYKILEYSAKEVPLDEGTLLRSAKVQKQGGKLIVGYNTEYAARLHYNPQYTFKNGRKALYLSDPIKNNAVKLKEYYLKFLENAMKSVGLK
jgi:HK97 gp10 family phage protein